jgi:hypothetical protein
MTKAQIAARLRARAESLRAVAARKGLAARKARETAARAEAAKVAYREARQGGANKNAAKRAADDAARSVRLSPLRPRSKRATGLQTPKKGIRGGGGGGEPPRMVIPPDRYDAIDYDIEDLGAAFDPDDEGEY